MASISFRVPVGLRDWWANPAAYKERKRRQLRRSPGLRLGIWQQLASTLKDLDPATALGAIAKGASEEGLRPNHPVAVAAEAWIVRLREGQTLSEAITGWCTDRERLLISAAEATASLSPVLTRMAEAERKLLAVKRQWRFGFVLPGFMLALGWGMVVYFAGFTADFIIQSKASNDEATQVLEITSVISNWLSWLVPLIAVLSGIAVWLALHYWRSPARTRVEWIWPFSTFKAMQAADFLFVLSVLKTAGYDEVQALTSMSLGAGSYLSWQIAALLDNSKSKSWGETLAAAQRRFPGAHVNALMATFSLNEQAYPDHLIQIADDWTANLVEQMRNAQEVAKTVISLVVAAFIAAAGLLQTAATAALQ